MSKASLDTTIRLDVMNSIATLISEKYNTDVLPVSASELVMPVVDAEGNEKFALIKVSVPRGTRVDGGYEPYDGYAAAEDYRLEYEEKVAKKIASENRKAEAEKEKQRKRELKQKKVRTNRTLTF